MRLLEGLVRRLAVARDADAYALRGGMLIQRWVPGRTVRDVDLVCALPYDKRELRGRIAEILATRISDGVVFDEIFRLDSVPSSPPAMQLFARGKVEGRRAALTADLAFGIAVSPVRMDGVFTCPPELVIATKLRVIETLGPRDWRPKDLADLWHLKHRLPHAIDRGVFAHAWWREPHTAMRWARHAARDHSVPTDLQQVLSQL